jgi:hypothetical protein
MISGAQALAAIDHALQGQRDQVRELNERVQGTSAELMQLSQAESEQYKALARIRVGQLATEEVIKTLDQAERLIGEFLTARECALSELVHKIDEARARQGALEAERAAQSQRVEQAAKELDEVEATVQERLAEDAAYQAQLERARQAEQTAAHAEKKTTLSEQDQIEKGKPYEEDPLFLYLWQRGYGTPSYTANPLIRYLDAKVAKLYGYFEARANYTLCVRRLRMARYWR